MNTTAAHLNHDTHASGERTLKEWADITGRVPASVMKTVRRKLGTGYSLESVMSADEWNGLFKTDAMPVRHKNADNSNTQTRQNSNTSKPKPSSAHPFTARTVILSLLMFVPAAASVQNMYTVTLDITEHTSSAILLTGLFSAAPFLFVMAGMRSEAAKALTGILIAYECFANVTRIYGGLTGFGRGDYPTRFLGLVTDIFNTGTYETAKLLALIMAAIAAAVFYAAYFELNRRPTK